MAHAEKRLIVSENLSRRPERCTLLTLTPTQTRRDGEGVKMFTAEGVLRGGGFCERFSGVQGYEVKGILCILQATERKVE